MPNRVVRQVYALALRTFRVLPAPVRRGLVRAGTPSFTVGAVAVLRHDGDVLFLRQPHRPGWSLPGGLLDRGEEAAEAVVREVWEETGVRIEVGPASTCLVNAEVRRVDIIYVIELAQRPEVTPGGEAQSHSWLSMDDIGVADDATHEIIDTVRTLDRRFEH